MATSGSPILAVVSGEAGGSWYIERVSDRWRQVAQTNVAPRSTVMLDHLTAWRLVTKRRSREAVTAQLPDIRIEGDTGLGIHVLDMVSMMA